jgi:hypothetical protein
MVNDKMVNMNKTHLFALLALVLAFTACTKEKARELPAFSDMTVTPEQSVYHVGDSVACSLSMLRSGDPSLKRATWWFYTSWWGADPEMTADFCTPDTVDGVVCFRSSKIALTQTGDVRIYFWGRLEYPDWDFRPVQIPVTLHVEP